LEGKVMIVLIGLVVLLVAVLVAVVGVASNTGSAHPLGDTFAVFGQPLTGHSTGELFLYGIVVGVVGMLGLSMLLGTFNRRLASRGSRRELRGSRRETAELRLDRERLTQQLDDVRTDRPAVHLGRIAPIPTTTVPPAAAQPQHLAQLPAAVDAASPERSGIWHRVSSRARH